MKQTRQQLIETDVAVIRQAAIDGDVRKALEAVANALENLLIEEEEDDAVEEKLAAAVNKAHVKAASERRSRR